MSSPTKPTMKSDIGSSAKKLIAPQDTVKKEVFQWSTPADEFADDVESDNEPDSEDEVEGEGDGQYYTQEEAQLIEQSELEKYTARLNGEKFVGHYDPEEQRRLREEEMMNTIKLEGGRRSKSKLKQKFPCPKCNKIWNWPWELRRHLIMHYKEKERHDATMYKCDECGKGFQWKRDLAQHKRLHTGEKLLICSVCGKKFTTRQALLHHVVVHTGEKPFQCAQCGNRFTQPANLRTHMKKKHEGVAIKNNKCPHCQENFPSVVAVHQHILEDHQNIVAEERQVQDLERMRKEQERAIRERQREESRRRREAKRKERIDLNDFKIKGLKEWEINYEFHIGDGIVRGVDWDRTPSNGELNCDLCERKFGWRYEIMFHNLCHITDEDGNPKNKVCPECETVFKVPIGLKHHLLTHTGELPFLCLHCWRSFASHIDLKLHLHREHLSHLDMPMPGVIKKKPKTEQLIVRKGHSKMETTTAEVQLVMTDEHGQHYTTGETQTIVMAADGTIVNHNNEDMIVVIQSGDFDRSQGLIVVDQSQIQHMVSGTTLTTADGTTMILGDASSGHNGEQSEMIVSDQGANGNQQTQYINLQFSDHQDLEDEDEECANTILLSSDHHFQTESGQQYVVVSSDDSKVGLQIQATSAIVQEMLEVPSEAENEHQESSEQSEVQRSQPEEQVATVIDSKSGIVVNYQIESQPQDQ